MKRIAKVLIGASATLALSLSLSGCFLLPLADGRSPFDDPSGPTRADVQKLIPAVEDAVSSVDVSPYELQVVEGSDNCEGPCKLSVAVEFIHPDPPSMSMREQWNEDPIPGELIAEVMIAAIPATNGEPLRVAAAPGEGTLEEAEHILAMLPEEIPALYYSNHEDEIYIPGDKLELALEAAQTYLDELP